MKKREVKRNIENKVLKLELTNETLDDIYESLPKIIKVCNKKYMIDLIYNNEKVDIDYITKNNITDKKLIDIIETVHAINLKDIKEKFNYIYDTVCAKLDERIKQIIVNLKMIYVLNIEEKVVIIKMVAANVKVEESVSI